MSKGVRFLLRLAMWLAVISYIAVAITFHSSKEKLYSGLEVRILDDQQKFVDAEIVASWLDTLLPKQMEKSFEQSQLYDIEQVLISKPYVQNVNVFSDMDGHCIVELLQREIAFRVISERGHDFFVDTLGFRLNPTGAWQKDVPVITTDFNLPFPVDEYGYVDSTLLNSSNYYLKNLCNFVKILQNDQFLDGLVTQTRITGNITPGKEMVHLIPRIGKQRIVLGNFANMPEKLENVDAFYSNTFKDGWWYYASEVCFQYGDKIIIKRKI